MEIRRTQHLQALCAERLAQLIQESHTPLLLLFSGGSSLALIELISPGVIPKDTTISMLDERCSENDADHNYAKLLKTPLGELIRSEFVYAIDPLPKEGESCEDTSIRFDHTLRLWREANPNGNIIITQGAGADGHTSGILPFPDDQKTFEELFLSERWAVSYEAPHTTNEFKKRITVTLSFLRDEVDMSLVYMSGEEKRSALDSILTPEGTLHEKPARIVREMKQVLLYTDIEKKSR